MGVNKVVYGGETLIDLTGDTVTADTLLEGETAHDKTGNKITGKLSVPKVVSITIANPPTKTEYQHGEYFDPAGMVIHVNYSNGIVGITSDYSYTPTAALTTNNTAVTISYTEGGVTVTATQTITVKKAISATFANNDWSTIVEACHNNTVPSTWVVGNNKTMTINGRSYKIDIIGKNHDTYSSGGTAPLTFQLHDCYLTQYNMYSSATATNSWKNSDMRNTHLPSILSTMPSEVRTGIRAVSKPCVDDGWTPKKENVTDTLFLLSEIEVFGKTIYSCSGEGSQYAYYAAGNSPIKGNNNWWTRSPVDDSSQGFISVIHNPDMWGTETITQSQTAAQKIAFAFCF